MSFKFVLLWLSVAALAFIRVAQLASFLPDTSPILANGVESSKVHFIPVSSTQSNGLTAPAPESTSPKSYTQPGFPTQTGSPSSPYSTNQEVTTNDNDNKNVDVEDFSQQQTPQSNSSSSLPPGVKPGETPNSNNDSTNAGQDTDVNRPPTKPTSTSSNLPTNPSSGSTNTKLNALIYSAFIVYVSIVKLTYHNFSPVKRYLTEPGILMMFGIIWELVARQVSSSPSNFPRFDSRIFFYLFLPSTILESAAFLSNKWLFLNMLQVLTLSIVGTLVYASALGYTIHSLNQFGLLQQQNQLTLPSFSSIASYNSIRTTKVPENRSLLNTFDQSELRHESLAILRESNLGTAPMQTSSMEIQNLTLVDCLIFGTMLSSIDSATLLNVFRQLQVNDRLYYLTLGETLLNNAVVLVLFDLLLDFFNTTNLNVVRIYSAFIWFFTTLAGAILIGSILACAALLAVRLTKHLQQPSFALLTYQNQSQAMVETLLILSLAYLAYTLARQVGTSSILSLTTFGIIQDKYIKHNLNFRSQLTLRQVILATKTLGYSLIYPLLGMLLVEVANSSQFYQTHMKSETGTPWSSALGSVDDQTAGDTTTGFTANSLKHMSSNGGLPWNFGFLAIVIVVVLFYRLLVVILFSGLCNICSSRNIKINLTEQLLLAYGGLKGPLAFALVSRLIEHEEYRYRTIPNKHLFMSTVLFITFVSTLVKGALVQPLVLKFQSRINSTLIRKSDNPSSVIPELNEKLSEYIEHGLKSITEHTRSDATRVKPWTTGSDCNTNWLSAFYESLILGESSNGNSFLRSAFQLGSRGSHPPSAGSSINRRNSDQSISRGTVIIRRRSSSLVEQVSSTEKRKRSLSRVGPASVNESSGQHTRNEQVMKDLQSNSRSSALKQLVMLNLKEEDARMRRDRTSANQDFDIHMGRGSRRTLQMISSTSLEDSRSPTHRIDLEKKRHMRQVERNLDESYSSVRSQSQGMTRSNTRRVHKRVNLR